MAGAIPPALNRQEAMSTSERSPAAPPNRSLSSTGWETQVAKRKITGTLYVSLSEYSDPDQLKNPDEAMALKALTFTSYDITSSSGYCKAGTATVTVELDDEKELVENKAASLRAEITKVRADAENAITNLTVKLNSLLALTNEAKS